MIIGDYITIIFLIFFPLFHHYSLLFPYLHTIVTIPKLPYTNTLHFTPTTYTIHIKSPTYSKDAYFNVEQLLNQVFENLQNETPLRPVDPSNEILQIQENFSELQDKLLFFKTEINQLEAEAERIFKKFVHEKGQSAGRFEELDLFRDVNQDIHKILLNFSNVYASLYGESIEMFGYTEETDKKIKEEDIHSTKKCKQTQSYKIEELFHLTVGSLVQVQNNFVNKCLLYHMFEVSHLMKDLTNFKQVFLGANGMVLQSLLSVLFTKNGGLKASGFENFKSNLEEIIYEQLNRDIQREKQAFLEFEMDKKKEASSQRAKDFRKRIEVLEEKKWLKADFRKTARVGGGSSKFFDCFGAELLEVESTFTDFRKFFFSSDILRFYINIFFEILKVSVFVTEA